MHTAIFPSPHSWKASRPHLYKIGGGGVVPVSKGRPMQGVGAIIVISLDCVDASSVKRAGMHFAIVHF